MDQKMEAVIKEGALKEQEKRQTLICIQELNHHLSRLLLVSGTEKRCDKDHLESSIKAADKIKDSAQDNDLYVTAREIGKTLRLINPRFGALQNDEFRSLYERLKEIKNFNATLSAANKAEEENKE